jgi:hypothetical protein
MNINKLIFKTKYSSSIILLNVSLLLFASCDCGHSMTGVVLDKETRLPVDSIIIGTMFDIRYSEYNYYTLTDSLGRFECSGLTGPSGFFKCSESKLIFRKSDYTSIEKVYPPGRTENDTILISRKNI